MPGTGSLGYVVANAWENLQKLWMQLVNMTLQLRGRSWNAMGPTWTSAVRRDRLTKATHSQQQRKGSKGLAT